MSGNKKSLSWLLGLRVLVVLIFLTGCSESMANKKKVVVWPAIEGYVYNDGEPVVGLVINQSVNWNARRGLILSSAKTDERGYFKFEAIVEPLNLGFLSSLTHQPGMGCELSIDYEGKEISLLASMAASYGDPNNEVNFSSYYIYRWDLVNIEKFSNSLIIDPDKEKAKND